MFQRFYLILFLLLHVATANEADLERLMEKVEIDVRELANQVELLHKSRCEEIDLSACYKGNFDDCQSQYPNSTCSTDKNFQIPDCERNGGSSIDYSISNFRLPRLVADGQNSNPTDPRVIEDICFTRALDEWFIDKREQDKSFWEPFGVQPQSMYFGSFTGAFRVYPARHSKQCGSFDPRIRPWYVAGSSGPKNVILILDTSGSMNGLRMDNMKSAAKRILNTLTVADRVGIVTFASDATVMATTQNTLFRAEKFNVGVLTERIDKLTATGQTNFQAAFTEAFALLRRTFDVELQVDCNTAILFLTDGEMTVPPEATDDDIISLVKSGVAEIEKETSNPVAFFSVSVSEIQGIHELPKKLACAATEYGVWSKVIDDDDIADSLAGYYKLFSLGLGQDTNEEFVAWAEPYNFATGNVRGTTVSAPVYDRSKETHVFLGVVGIDFDMSALDQSLGVESGNKLTFEKIVKRSIARCPRLDVGLCVLESYRRSGVAGNEALCDPGNCTIGDYVDIEEKQCSAVPDYPQDLIANRELDGKSYVDRGCCNTPGSHGGSSQGAYGAKPAAFVFWMMVAMASLL